MRQERVVVVGGGMGGLSCAIDLATAGYAVTVLERAATPGGKMHQAAVGDARIDGGPTILTMRWVFDSLFRDAGAALDDHVTLKPATVLARHAWSGNQALDLYADVDRSADAIGALAGAREAKGYRAFAAESADIYRTLRDTFLTRDRCGLVGLSWRIALQDAPALFRLRPYETLWGALGDHFQDPRLRQLFGRYATYCGASPFEAPATLMLIAHVEQEGVWLVDGDMKKLADALAALAAARGVTIRYGEQVAGVATQSGRASGVDLASGERIEADAVVVNADADALNAGAFGEAATGMVPGTRRPVRSLSAVTFSTVARTSGFPLARHNVFFSGDYEAEFRDLAAGRPPSEPTIYVCAQDRDDEGRGVGAGDAERIFALINAPADGDTRTMDERELLQCETTVFEHLRRCGLEATPSGPSVVKTPADFNALFPGTGGALYGRAMHGWAAAFQRPGSATRMPGLYLAGGSVHPGAGVPMAALVGAARGQEADAGPRFDVAVPNTGYRWWYVDALSDDGRFGLTVIAFIGSVFSPYYAKTRWADPLDHCTINIALYGPRGPVWRPGWSMTERGRGDLTQEAHHLSVGASSLSWEGDTLVLRLDETTTPVPMPLKGVIRLHPQALIPRQFEIGGVGRHVWRPIAPRARVEASFTHPAVSWSGNGYFDTNGGDSPLETSFSDWTWSRAHRKRDSLIFYDVGPDDDRGVHLALKIDEAGEVEEITPPPFQSVRPTAWLMPRRVRSDPAHRPRLRTTLEDAPFYSRSALDGFYDGEPAEILHESLSASRLRSPSSRPCSPTACPGGSDEGGGGSPFGLGVRSFQISQAAKPTTPSSSRLCAIRGTGLICGSKYRRKPREGSRFQPIHPSPDQRSKRAASPSAFFGLSLER